MQNAIIIVILICLVAVGVVYTVKHFTGEGGCCGGDSCKMKRKKLPHVRYEKTFLVQGMHCDHCKARVERAINDIQGVAARANWKKGEVVVSYAEDVADEVIARQLQRDGYQVTGQK